MEDGGETKKLVVKRDMSRSQISEVIPPWALEQPEAKTMSELRRLELRAVIMIQRGFRRLVKRKISNRNRVPREDFEDLYVRFLMFLDVSLFFSLKA